MPEPYEADSSSTFWACVAGSNGFHRSAFTLLEALLGLALLCMMVLVIVAMNGRSLRAFSDSQSLDQATTAAEDLIAGSMSRLPVADSAHADPSGLRWRVETTKREIASEVYLDETSIVIEENRPRGRQLCTLQVLVPQRQ